jgi:hypothetical protein
VFDACVPAAAAHRLRDGEASPYFSFERIAMTQSQLDCAVALATGEDIDTINRLGFSLADPAVVQFDPEPRERVSQIIGRDARDAQRARVSR